MSKALDIQAPSDDGQSLEAAVPIDVLSASDQEDNLALLRFVSGDGQLLDQFEPGSVIYKDVKPFVYSLNLDMKYKVCDYCFEKGALRGCGHCKQVYYHGADCQRADWRNIHRYECPLLAKAKERNINLNDFERFFLRLHLKLTNSPESIDQLHQTHIEGKKRSYQDLCFHEEMFGHHNRMLAFAKLMDNFGQLIRDLDHKDMFIQFRRAVVNSFGITNLELNTIGTGLYIATSCINHSCMPNAVPMFKGPTMYVKAIRQIKQGEEVFTSYLDLKENVKTRRADLKDSYYFDCNCHRCEAELGLCNYKFEMATQKELEAIKHLCVEADEFVELAHETMNRNTWKKGYEANKRLLQIYQRIYSFSGYHPDLTVQLMRVVKLKGHLLEDDSEARKPEFMKMLKELEQALWVTHGSDHPLYDQYLDLYGSICPPPSRRN